MIYLNDHTEDIDLELALQNISEQRREQALKIRHEQGRRLCVAAYLLLKEGLQKEYDISENPVFGYGENGKPFIIGHPEIHFNMSHCKAGAICVLDRQPVGVDMETVREFKESLIRYTMSDEEQQLIADATTPRLMFTRLWTMKEALQKLTGKGITNHMREVLRDAERYDFTTVVGNGEQYVYTIARNRP